jgi:HK97 gp10 family phage protein
MAARLKVGSTQAVRGAAGVRVYGIEETVARLSRINTVTRIEIGFLMKGAAAEIEHLAIEKAPEATGNLKASIQASQVGPYTHIVVADTTLGPVPEKNYYEYAGYVEFGTSKMDARPFMAPAAEEVEPMVMAEIHRIAARITSL